MSGMAGKAARERGRYEMENSDAGQRISLPKGDLIRKRVPV
jgi:hypothetical protein